MTRRRDALIAAMLLISVTIAAVAVMAQFRRAGIGPDFYQSNFEPAVMLACGRGFGVTVPTLPALGEFLAVRVNRFDCASIPADAVIRPLTSAAHANWYYMYGAAAAVWRVAGVSWTSIDALVGLLAGISTVVVYGLMRLVSPWFVAVPIALVLAVSPTNVMRLLSLRDYSKAPFVLGALLVLALVLTRSRRLAATLAAAAGYGVIVGIGYGFRADLIVMVPFGVVMVLCFLPPLEGTRRLVANGAAAAVLLVTFVLTAMPILNGMKYGGCQYHFSLLGLTTPLAAEMRLTTPAYRFGDSLTDSFVDLKTGDYASRVFNEPAPGLCTADYDRASGELYFTYVRTFPADMVVRAYASTLMILRVGLWIPMMQQITPAFTGLEAALTGYRLLDRVTSLAAPLGPVVVLAALVILFAHSARLGLAATAAVLFLTGYPAVQFEERHWFHLRFLPWWSLALLATIAWQRWRTPDWPALRRGGLSVAAVLAVLAVSLSAIRVVQAGAVRQLIGRYLAAETDPIALDAVSGSVVPVRWEPNDVGAQPNHRGSDLLVITLDPAVCGTRPLTVGIKYQADAPSHDLSSATPVTMQTGAITRLFVPVFWQGLADHTYLRFHAVELPDAPAGCLAQVARVRDRAALPMWLQVDASAGWEQRPLYESMRVPRLFNR